MIRFHCPQCHGRLKVTEERAGRPITCPRCHAHTIVPADPSWTSSVEDGGAAAGAHGLPADAASEPARGLLTGMSGWLRWAVVLVAAVGLLSVLLAVLAPFLSRSEDLVATARQEVVIIAPSCLVILMVLLYGHLTSCPACGKWLARTEGETLSLGRDVADRGDSRVVRARRQTNYHCKYCRHTWSATYTDEYEATGKARPKKARG